MSDNLKRIKDHFGLLLLLLLSCALAPLALDFIKPYRLRVDLTLHYENPTDIEIYHSTSRKNPNFFRSEDVVPFVTPIQIGDTTHLAREVAYIASNRPITGLRLDTGNIPNHFTIQSLSVHSPFSETSFKVEEIADLVKRGVQIANVHAADQGLQFETTGNDAYFLIPIPSLIGIPARSEVGLWYVFSWLVSLSLLFLVKISIFTPRVKISGNGAGPAQTEEIPPYLHVVASRTYNLLGLVLLGYSLLQLIGLTVGMDFSHVRKAFEPDRVSSAIPAEVFWIKALAKRQGVDAFVLAGDLGKGEDESEIYQRATEYLYPIKVVQGTQWVMARGNDLQTAGRPDCKARDHQEGIVLYACEK